MTLDDLKRIQEINTELLNEVVNICEKNNIKYYLVFGTLLGAVRHGGSIPWDSDVDIAMTRENYNKFLEVYCEELSPENVLYIMGSGSSKYVSEIKIGRKGTRIDLPGTEDFDIMHEINLDIFLLDYLKNHNSFLKRLFDKFRKLILIAKLCWGEKKLLFYSIDHSTHKFKIFYKAGIFLSHIFPLIFGEKNLEKLLYKIYVDKTGTSSKMGIVKSTKCKYYDRSIFEQELCMKYGDREYSVPCGYDAFLSGEYGDYMRLPPEDRRYMPHFESYVLEVK